MSSIKNIRCGTCWFFAGGGGEGGECRRFPPTTRHDGDGDFETSYPLVSKTGNGCGEWRQSADDKPAVSQTFGLIEQNVQLSQEISRLRRVIDCLVPHGSKATPD